MQLLIDKLKLMMARILLINKRISVILYLLFFVESKNKLMRDFTLKQEAVSLDHRAAAVAVDCKLF